MHEVGVREWRDKVCRNVAQSCLFWWLDVMRCHVTSDTPFSPFWNKVGISRVFWNLVRRRHFHILRRSCVLHLQSRFPGKESSHGVDWEVCLMILENRFLWLYFLYVFFFWHLETSEFLLHKDQWALPLKSLWCLSRGVSSMHTWGGFLPHVTGKLEVWFQAPGGRLRSRVFWAVAEQRWWFPIPEEFSVPGLCFSKKCTHVNESVFMTVFSFRVWL